MIAHFMSVAGGQGQLPGSETDPLGLLISTAALVVAIMTSLSNVRTTRRISKENNAHASAMARSATYQRLHESLVDPKAAAGRRLLFEASRSQRFPSLGGAGWDEINYSLALFDTLAGYMARGEVEERVVLEAWHHPLTNISGPVREFMAYRERQSIYQPWAHLLTMLCKAEAHVCSCPSPPNLDRPLPVVASVAPNS